MRSMVMEDKQKELEDKIPSATRLKKNMKIVMDDWMLGPERASESRTANRRYWIKIGSAWSLDEASARRRNCGNCEYGNTTPEAIKAMEKIPNSRFDDDGGGRVWCEKFDFICHNLRVCQRWDRKEFYGSEE